MVPAHPETDLVPYLRGELDAAARERIARHLADCPQCRQTLDWSQSTLRELAREVENFAEPDWRIYRSQLRRKLAAREQGAARGWRPPIGWAWLGVASAAVAALLLVIVLSPSRRTTTPPVSQLAIEDALAGADVGLLRDYQVVASLDLLENYEVIEHLDELAPPERNDHESRS